MIPAELRRRITAGITDPGHNKANGDFKSPLLEILMRFGANACVYGESNVRRQLIKIEKWTGRNEPSGSV